MTDAPDWQEVATLVDMAMTDSPDWQTTLTGPGGSDIGGGSTVYYQSLATPVTGGTTSLLLSQVVPAGTYVIWGKAGISSSNPFETNGGLGLNPVARAMSASWDWAPYAVGSAAGAAGNVTVTVMTYQVFAISTTVYLNWTSDAGTVVLNNANGPTCELVCMSIG